MSRLRKAAVGLAAVLGLWALLALVPPSPRPVHPYFAGLEGLQVIAHRGGADVAPEGTLPLFRQADSLGADILELDLRRSADGDSPMPSEATLMIGTLSPPGVRSR